MKNALYISIVKGIWRLYINKKNATDNRICFKKYN